MNKELSITLGLLYSAELEEVDSVSSVVYKLFEYQQNGYYLVQNVISKEIESTGRIIYLLMANGKIIF